MGPTSRIAVLQPSISITLDRIGALDAVVACTRYCIEAVPELSQRGVRIIQDSWSCTMDEILAIRPTLMLASVPYRQESLAALLKAGCPVLALAPHTLRDVYADIRLLGSIVDRAENANTLAADMARPIDAMRVQTAAATLRPRVYCEEWGKPLIHSQPWVAELVAAAGGQFLGEPGRQTTPEAIAAADPDVLVFAWCGAGDRVPLERLVRQRNWQNLRAVRKGQVFCIPDEWLNTPAPTLLDGLEALAAAIHPRLFPAKERVRALDTIASAGITI